MKTFFGLVIIYILLTQNHRTSIWTRHHLEGTCTLMLLHLTNFQHCCTAVFTVWTSGLQAENLSFGKIVWKNVLFGDGRVILGTALTFSPDPS